MASTTLPFLSKNHVYENIQAQIWPNFKNIVVNLYVAISISFRGSEKKDVLMKKRSVCVQFFSFISAFEYKYNNKYNKNNHNDNNNQNKMKKNIKTLKKNKKHKNIKNNNNNDNSKVILAKLSIFDTVILRESFILLISEQLSHSITLPNMNSYLYIIYFNYIFIILAKLAIFDTVIL